MFDFHFYSRFLRSSAAVWLLGLVAGTGAGLLVVYVLLRLSA